MHGKPPVVENSLCYNGSYYCVGGERKTVVTDKTADEDFFLLTLVAVRYLYRVCLCSFRCCNN